ncbi:hypothetical protein [Vibrio algarum]|uniref:Uncharacterized protein n=1 Tax=Vibrio algarum TaxID=3020714 RepID=A0ABT4YY83_9VIBR|nr:hypothetical protein [Vibrio sp. KJ40-1]MDB1125984.1 hypothetical protein [Vibrio sp. KJ40-1]
MKRRRWIDESEYDETIFNRSYLVTFGAFMLLVMLLVVASAGVNDFASMVFPLIFASIGAVFIYIGFFSTSKTVKEWADTSSKHEIFVLLMIIATPTYWVWMKLGKAHKRA